MCPPIPTASNKKLNVAATVAAAAAYVRSAAQERGLGTVAVGIEPGRAIVADAGTTLYRVLAVKCQSQRTFIVVDGGIAENPRPALYGARYHVDAVTPRHGEDEEITLCGRSCENDELGTMRLPRDVAPGRSPRDALDRRVHLQHGRKLQPLSQTSRRRDRKRHPPVASAPRNHRRRPPQRRRLGCRVVALRDAEEALHDERSPDGGARRQAVGAEHGCGATSGSSASRRATTRQA